MGVDIPAMLAKAARLPRAQMAELVDAPASGAGARKGVEVRVLFWAPFFNPKASQEGRQNGRILPLIALTVPVQCQAIPYGLVP